MKFSDSDTRTLENVERGKFHIKIPANFTTLLADKKGENIHSALLQGLYSEKKRLVFSRRVEKTSRRLEQRVTQRTLPY